MKLLEYVMHEQGVTQAELAERTGIHRATINRIVRGHETAWPAWRTRIADALGQPIEDADRLFEEIEVAR